MATAVVTIASGGTPVVDVTADATLKKYAVAVTEAAVGVRVTKVTSPAAGVPVCYVVPPL